MPDAPWTFGEQPLAETCELAELLRVVAGYALALEQPTDALRHAVSSLRSIETGLRNDLPSSLRPRIGARDAPDHRVYLDHSRDIGAYNPCVPSYELSCREDRAEGSVEFPIAYEGPPGAVHGGFLAVLFDCVLQQLSCDLGATGSTSALEVRYRRPTPLHTRLRISATREVDGDRITSNAQLHRDAQLLCEATMTSVAIERDTLPATSPRRAS
jgi:acyl-coenzyme A thioesterase PaaI-like protein